MQRRYKSTECDMKVLVSEINQKCHDSNVVRVKKELSTTSCPSGSEANGAGKEASNGKF